MLQMYAGALGTTWGFDGIAVHQAIPDAHAPAIYAGLCGWCHGEPHACLVAGTFMLYAHNEQQASCLSSFA